MRTLRIDKETNPLGQTKFYLMYQATENGVFSPIGFSYEEEEILKQYEQAKANLLIADQTKTEVIKQETL